MSSMQGPLSFSFSWWNGSNWSWEGVIITCNSSWTCISRLTISSTAPCTKNGKPRSLTIHKIIHCYLGPIVVHFLSTCDCFGFYPWCKVVYIDKQVNLCMLLFLLFSYPLNSLNRVRICAGTPYSSPRDLQHQDRVIARFSCYSTKTNLDIVRNFVKSCQVTNLLTVPYWHHSPAQRCGMLVGLCMAS